MSLIVSRSVVVSAPRIGLTTANSIVVVVWSSWPAKLSRCSRPPLIYFPLVRPNFDLSSLSIHFHHLFVFFSCFRPFASCSRREATRNIVQSWPANKHEQTNKQTMICTLCVECFAYNLDGLFLSCNTCDDHQDDHHDWQGKLMRRTGEPDWRASKCNRPKGARELIALIVEVVAAATVVEMRRWSAHPASRGQSRQVSVDGLIVVRLFVWWPVEHVNVSISDHWQEFALLAGGQDDKLLLLVVCVAFGPNQLNLLVVSLHQQQQQHFWQSETTTRTSC